MDHSVYGPVVHLNAEVPPGQRREYRDLPLMGGCCPVTHKRPPFSAHGRLTARVPLEHGDELRGAVRLDGGAGGGDELGATAPRAQFGRALDRHVHFAQPRHERIVVRRPLGVPNSAKKRRKKEREWE